MAEHLSLLLYMRGRVVEHLPSFPEALGAIPTATEQKQNKEKVKMLHRVLRGTVAHQRCTFSPGHPEFSMEATLLPRCEQ